ncbi:MAG: diacylglycerol/lipid kinase family protein [Polyangiales bacterium]
MDSKPPLANAARFGTAADRVAVVVNGRAKQVTEELVETLDQIVQSGDLFVSRSLEEGKEIARIIVERGYPTVLTGGGDGTFVQMVSWIVQVADELGRALPRFGLLKLGTGNALAWVLGAQYRRGRGVVADLARLRSEGGSSTLRMIEVEDMLTPFGGLGADAIALEHHRATKQLFERTPVLKHFANGVITYSVSLLGRSVPRFLLAPAPRFRVVNEGEPAVMLGQDGQPVGREIGPGEVLYEGPAYIMAFSTIPYWGFGARIFPYAEERADRFDLRVVSFGSIEAVTHVRSIWRGSHHSDRLHDFLVERVRIECEKPTPLQIGGDVVGMRQLVRASLSKRQIRVVDYYAPPPVE